MSRITLAAIVTYIAAIATANLLVAAYGPRVLIVNAFILIGLDLVLRDFLHDAFTTHRAARMGGLIATAALVAYVVDPSSGRIAASSAVAFALASFADWAVYASVRRSPWLVRSNTSNVAGAAVDSVAFPLLAFGAPLLVPVVAGMFLAKLVGGAAWSLVIEGGRRAAAHDH